ncbi:MAG: MerR family transcriptional regulator [Duodenibacillus sp.]|nr:MerR family transcriptional regulator [Duodenibacillus sp.]
MRIGELAAAAGVAVETVRFYESRGLLSPAVRLPNGYRAYAERHLEQLSFIRRCRSLDISLEDIARLLALDAGREPDACEAHALIDAKLASVEERIAGLEELRGHLLRLKGLCRGHAQGRCGLLDGLTASCCAPGPLRRTP